MAKYPTTALQAASSASLDDVVKLGKGIRDAGRAARQSPGIASAFLERNKKQPTGFEPVVTGPSVAGGEPAGTKVIARSKLSNQNLRNSKSGIPPVNPGY